jgi:hypothetical protein
VLISARAPSCPFPPPAKGARDRVTVTYSQNSIPLGDTWLGDILSNGAAKPEPFRHGEQMKTITRSTIYLP